MLQITPHNKIFLAVEPVDFRRGIDGLAGLCRQQLDKEPFTGDLFVFTNRRRKALKVLVYDGQGFWLCQKRLSEGKFSWWPTSDNPVANLSASELIVLLYNGDPTKAALAPDWRKLEDKSKPPPSSSD